MRSVLQALRGFRLPTLAARRPDADVGRAPAGHRTLRIYFIKPSRYDEDGSVLAFRWGVIPNNTLIVLGGLAEAYGRERPELRLQIVLWDELVDGVLTPALIASIRNRGVADSVEVIIGLAGVQSNQYPRARDLALQCVRLGLPVLIGGFHVSSHAPSRDFLASVGVTVVVGEAENTWPVILDDYLRGALQLGYQVADGLRVRTGQGDIVVPRIEAASLPAIDARYMARFFNPTFSTIDTSRGCPFVCSYCSVKNVMGRTMRSRDPDAVLAWLRDAHDRHGVRNVLVVDDDFFRSPQWEPILLGMAELRRGGRALAFVLQTDIEASVDAAPLPGEAETARHRRSRRFVELAAQAGCFEVFMGFESFNPANLERTMKLHNEDPRDRRGRHAAVEKAARVKARYKRAVDNWHAAGVGVHCGYIIGLPFDGEGCGRQAARDLTEIGVDIASFFVYTPFPGTEDYAAACAAGTLLEADLNAYDSTHCVHTHPSLLPRQLEREYRDAYRSFYAWRRLAWSIATGHRVAGLGMSARTGMLTQQIYFTYASRRGFHPMMGGIGRRRDRDTRRQVVTDEAAAVLYLGAVPHAPAAYAAAS